MTRVTKADLEATIDGNAFELDRLRKKTEQLLANVRNLEHERNVARKDLHVAKDQLKDQRQRTVKATAVLEMVIDCMYPPEQDQWGANVEVKPKDMDESQRFLRHILAMIYES